MIEPPNAFAITGLSKAFGATQALGAIDLSIVAGAIHGLVGGNGAGKSTLMKILAGVHRSGSGAIKLFGAPYAPRSPLEAQQRGVVMIPQELSIVPGMTVADNVMLGRWPSVQLGRGLRMPLADTKRTRQIAGQVLDSLGVRIGLGALTGSLSFAERQSIVIARAIACDARVLIFDEPTAALAGHEVDALFALIRALQRRHVTILYISHRLAEIETLCDRVTALQDGKVAASFRKGEFSRADLEAAITGRSGDTRPGRGAIAISQGAALEAPAPHPSQTVRFQPGRILGLHGLLGSGIGHWLKSVFGAHGPRGVTLGTRSIQLTSPADAIRLGIGYVPSERPSAIVPALSVRDNILLPHLGQFSRLGRLLEKDMDVAVRPLMAALDIRPRDPARPAGTLSGGNQQKVLFARWMLGTTRVLLLDEPMHGIDAGAKVLIKQKIGEFARSGGAVAMHSIDMEDLAGVADHVRTMDAGRLSPPHEPGAAASLAS